MLKYHLGRHEKDFRVCKKHYVEKKKVVHPIYVLSYSISSRYSKRDDYYFISINYGTYSELSNKHAANLILFEKIFPPTCLIRTYTFIYFQGKFLPTRLLEYLCLLILAEIPNYKIILSSFKLLFCCFKHFKEASRS